MFRQKKFYNNKCPLPYFHTLSSSFPIDFLNLLPLRFSFLRMLSRTFYTLSKSMSFLHKRSLTVFRSLLSALCFGVKALEVVHTVCTPKTSIWRKETLAPPPLSSNPFISTFSTQPILFQIFGTHTPVDDDLLSFYRLPSQKTSFYVNNTSPCSLYVSVPLSLSVSFSLHPVIKSIE